ncbi:fungal hydrophobin [Punctularia strigosozonata HHB-11173 SS5]|uniref:fungal hydrophobin n=1 Tax=Punctularia strigosozonata (strain HHB-11173) TaxID=741275 RepID=UPI00044164EC|nr:fungal hydrophobin [Punctularia strigosozonata HHB-11173 SS5]EIN08633.1 fungal hydrophobin [Punctularia strigosozonata HHB-11173 SS5]
MFARSTLAVAFAALLAVATAAPQGTAPSQCNTGSIQCCQSTKKVSSSSVNALGGLLGVVVDAVDALVGVDCSPISVVGLGGNSCSATPVCCENNSFKGLIALGCVPVNLSL